MRNTSPYRSARGGDADHTPYVTVTQAARRLQVSPSTIWRWIDAKKLPAYRLGEKTIRVRREDLDALIRPANAATHTTQEGALMGLPVFTRLRTSPLASEEIARGLAAVGKAAGSRADQLARRQGQPSPSSSDLVREIREELGARR